MKWNERRRSSNVEDRRASGGGKMIGGGFGLILLLIIGFLTGGNPIDLINMGISNAPSGQVEYVETEQERALSEFVSVILADTEDVWHAIFKQYNMKYEEPGLVLFKDRVQSGCGLADAGMGPFYCPADKKIYIDLIFYDELARDFNAPGDFALAYVIAHEVGHHVQNLLGTSGQVQDLRRKLPEAEYNKYLKRLELQADFYAGVWAHYVDKMNYLDQGDIEEALNAASAIGDDRIQQEARGYVVPDTFTHGTSEQRVNWFYKGYQTGDIRQGNTFDYNEDEL